MNTIDAIVLSPFICLTVAAVVIMLVIAFFRNHKLVFGLTLAGLAATFASLFVALPVLPRAVTPLLIVDHYAIFFDGLITAASLVVALLAYGYLEKQEEKPEEFYLLLLLATIGSVILVSSNHFASFFLGLEILSVSLYPLIAYRRGNPLGIEAGLKYLVLAGVSSAFLLFGMALVYADLGTLHLTEIALQTAKSNHYSILLLAGLGLVIVGIGFKLALVPFHLWTPDVYQGAPAPVTAFVATVSKGAMFVLLLRYFTGVNFHQNESLVLIFGIVAAASMVAGNLLALLQNNVKRLLAYSSIAHLGYLLVAFLAGGSMAVTAVAYFLTAYFVTTLGAFGIVTVFSGRDREADVIEDYQGLAWERPWVAAIFSVVLLSLAGIPLTAGFLGKFYVLAAGAGSDLWWLVLILIITSAIGLFYYLRVVVAMYRLPSPEIEPSPTELSIPLGGSVVLAILLLLLVWLGVYPAPLINLIQNALANLT